MDNARVDSGDRLEAEPEPFGGIDAHIVEQHVGVRDQPGERGASLGPLEVDGEHPLVAVVVDEQRPAALAAWEIGRAHAELQSLMRISYAVFCLKKKTYPQYITPPIKINTCQYSLHNITA